MVCCLRNFYRQLRHRFRYGQVDGSEWFMANGLAQGCPTSPDLMNVLFEPFHRWAAAQKKEVAVADTFVASASFSDDVNIGGGCVRRGAVPRLQLHSVVQSATNAAQCSKSTDMVKSRGIGAGVQGEIWRGWGTLGCAEISDLLPRCCLAWSEWKRDFFWTSENSPAASYVGDGKGA